MVHCTPPAAALLPSIVLFAVGLRAWVQGWAAVWNLAALVALRGYTELVWQGWALGRYNTMYRFVVLVCFCAATSRNADSHLKHSATVHTSL